MSYFLSLPAWPIQAGRLCDGGSPAQRRVSPGFIPDPIHVYELSKTAVRQAPAVLGMNRVAGLIREGAAAFAAADGTLGRLDGRAFGLGRFGELAHDP